MAGIEYDGVPIDLRFTQGEDRRIPLLVWTVPRVGDLVAHDGVFYKVNGVTHRIELHSYPEIEVWLETA